MLQSFNHQIFIYNIVYQLNQMFSEIELNTSTKFKKEIPQQSDLCDNSKGLKSSAQQKIKPQWQWYPCDFILNQQINGQSIYWSLQQNIIFTSPTDPQKILSVKINVTSQKQFDFTDLQGWLWHKTWIIPTLIVNIQVTGSQTTQKFQFPQNTYIQILAVKAASKTIQKFHLIDVGLQGMQPQEAQVGKHIFQGMKFNETSYKHQGSKFNLVVALIHRAQGQAHPLVIDIKISPPIFIDSRRSAREDCEVRTMIYFKKINKVFDKFTPDMFTKTLFKRKREEQQIISNDGNGFLNYFKAPNIRNKIKNPFFLTYKFSNFITLYYNSHKINNRKDLIKICMDKFDQIPHITLNKSKPKSKKNQTEIDKVNPDAYLSLVLHTKNKNDITKLSRQILQKFGNYDSTLINVLFDSSFLPKKYIPINDPEEIRSSYQNYFYLNNYYNQEGKDTIKKLLKQDREQKSRTININIESQHQDLQKATSIHTNSLKTTQIQNNQAQNSINLLFNQQLLAKQLELQNLIRLNELNQLNNTLNSLNSQFFNFGYKQNNVYEELLKLILPKI